MTTLRLLQRNRLAAAGLLVLLAIVLIVLFAAALPLVDPNVTDPANRLRRPMAYGFDLGTDHLGRDLLSRLIWGTQLSLAVGCAAALLAAVIGSTIGVVAGYFGSRVDSFLMRGVDMLMAFPYILLALAIVAVLGPGLLNALYAVAIVNIPFFARNIRGATVTIVHREFIDSARLAGLSNWRIIFSEVLPNVLPVIVIAMSTTVGWMILETAGLSFLGLGSQPPQADLGSMLGEGRKLLINAPHVSVVPGVMIFIIVISVNLLGDGVRDALDPRLRAGSLSRPGAATRTERTVDTVSPVPPEPRSLLCVRRLATEFRVFDRVIRAVNDVDFDLAAGECLGVVGESGSGKSVAALSLLKLVASPPGVIAAGSAHLSGRTGEAPTDLLSLQGEALRTIRGRRVSYVFQDPSTTLHPLYKVGDQIVEAIRAHRAISYQQASREAVELLDRVRLPNPAARAKQYTHELSGGMRQRVGIALALANDPELIIADEPTTALDVTVQAQILSLLDELRRERDLALIFITHDFAVVAQLCDRVAVMYAGRIVESGSTNTLLNSPRHPYTRSLIGCVPKLGGGRRELAAIPGFPPAIDALPSGCAFAARCPKVRADCELEAPPQFVSANRVVRCHFPEPEPN